MRKRPKTPKKRRGSLFRSRKIIPVDEAEDRRSSQAERFLALLDPPARNERSEEGLSDEAILLELRLRKSRALAEAVDLAAMCGRSDSELDELLLRLAGSGSDDLLREVLAVTKALRCPTSQLLRIMEDCVVVEAMQLDIFQRYRPRTNGPVDRDTPPVGHDRRVVGSGSKANSGSCCPIAEHSRSDDGRKIF